MYYENLEQMGASVKHLTIHQILTSESSRSTEFKNIFPWSISQIISKTAPISMAIVISYAETGHHV